MCAVLQYLLDRFYPLSSTTVASRDPAFVTPKIKSLLRQKNCLMHKGRVEEANALAVKIRKEIIEFNCMTFTGANSKGGAKDLWDKVNEVLGKKKSAAQDSSLSTFTSQQLNEHYANLSFDNSYESIDCKSTVYPVSLSSLTEFDVYNMLDHLKPTSPGLDGLPSWFLRVLAPVICSPLTHIFNLSFSLSTYPSQWKQAVITPLPKVSTPNSCLDFRPISITSILSHTCEKLIINSFCCVLCQATFP